MDKYAYHFVQLILIANRTKVSWILEKGMNEIGLVSNPYSDLKQVGINGIGNEYERWSIQVMIIHEDKQ